MVFQEIILTLNISKPKCDNCKCHTHHMTKAFAANSLTGAIDICYGALSLLVQTRIMHRSLMKIKSSDK